MRKRKNIDYGKEMAPEQLFADWRRETNASLAVTITPERMRYDPAEDAEPAP